MKKKFLRAYYFVTAWVPRLLPRDNQEWHALKQTLVDYYGLVDTGGTWATVAGHVTSTPAYRRRRSYQYLANVALRLTVNAAAQDVRKQAIEELQNLLATKMAQAAADDVEKQAAETMTGEPSETGTPAEADKSHA